MIRANKMDNPIAMGFNVDLMPSMYEGTTTAPFKPEDVKKFDSKLNGSVVVSRGEFGVVPIQFNKNVIASENPNLPKITTPDEMIKNAMKPVGDGAEVFQPFNLLYNTDKRSDYNVR